MIEGLKPYAEYKESEVPWIGKIPQHWRILPNRALLKLKKKSVGDTSGEYTLLSLTKQGVIPRDLENPSGKFPANFETYQIVEPGDLIFCLFDIDETPRAVGLSNLQGMITGAYTRFTCNDPSHNRFVYLFYLAMDNGKLLKPLYSGLRKVITKSTFLSAKTPFPPQEEQAAIVRFLDHANRKIDRFIRTKRRLIELLNEQKQVLINRAMTQGIDPNVSLKLSYIPWLRDLPSHWSLVPIKRLLSRMDYGTSEASNETGNIRVLTMGNIQKGEVILPRSGGLDEVPDFLLLEHGDLLFTRTNGNPELVGKVGIFRGQLSDNVSFASYLVRLRVKKPYNPQWLHLLLNSASFWPFARSYALVNLQTNLNSTRYGQFLVPVPPPSEQTQIVEWIGEASKALNATIDRAQREITLLREFRTRLISDVVTGKVDVRCLELPEMDETETLKEIDTGEDIEAEELLESDEVADADE